MNVNDPNAIGLLCNRRFNAIGCIDRTLWLLWYKYWTIDQIHKYLICLLMKMEGKRKKKEICICRNINWILGPQVEENSETFVVASWNYHRMEDRKLTLQ